MSDAYEPLVELSMNIPRAFVELDERREFAQTKLSATRFLLFLLYCEIETVGQCNVESPAI